MLGQRQIHNLALIGFMGTGKSSVGRLVADTLHFTFLDTDHVIEARAGLTICEIFQRQGEAAFRDLERRIVAELARRKKTVISTGGGLPVNEANLVSLKTHALVVCLWASPEKIFERVHDHSHRPLSSVLCAKWLGKSFISFVWRRLLIDERSNQVPGKRVGV